MDLSPLDRAAVDKEGKIQNIVEGSAPSIPSAIEIWLSLKVRESGRSSAG